MQLIIVGSQGNVGRRLMAAFPASIGWDRQEDADMQVDLTSVDYDDPAIIEIMEKADGLVHVGTSADPYAPDAIHWQAVLDATRLVAACARIPVPRLVLPSSGWAEPAPGLWLNTYAHSKRVFESLAAMYAQSTGQRATALRLGWLPHDASAVAEASPDLRAAYWDDARLIAEMRTALGV